VINAIVNFITGGLVDKVLDLGKAYLTKQISQAEFEAQVKIAASETAAKVEESWAQAAAKINSSTQSTVRASRILQRAWASTMMLQLFVLAWYQIGAPAYLVLTGTPWPDPGATVEWAYLLLGAMLGAGPFVFKR
jgi:hypothetical protein